VAKLLAVPGAPGLGSERRRANALGSTGYGRDPKLDCPVPGMRQVRRLRPQDLQAAWFPNRDLFGNSFVRPRQKAKI